MGSSESWEIFYFTGTAEEKQDSGINGKGGTLFYTGQQQVEKDLVERRNKNNKMRGKIK